MYGISGATLLNSIYLIFENKKSLWTIILTKTIYRKEEIRFSISYLYRIKINSKYFLVRSKRIENLFQPVGGVYKRLPESVKIFKELKIKDDQNLPIDNNSESDLRIRVPGNNVDKFLKWYYSEEDREVSHWREFCEELIRTGILDVNKFPHFQYRKIRQEQEILKWSDFHRCYEYKIFDILEPIFNDSQTEDFKKLINLKSEDFKWVEEPLILGLGHDNTSKKSNFRIGDQTKYII